MRKWLLLLIGAALLVPAVAAARPHGGEQRRDDRDQRIARVIRDCEDRTNDFLRAVERGWGQDRRRNDELDRAAANLERSMNRVRDSWNRDHDYRRTRGNIGSAINAGRQVNRILAHHRLRGSVEHEWAAIRSELDNLADVFEQPKIRW